MVRQLKILLFNWRCPKHPQAGGAEKATYEITKRWASWGHEVRWMSASFKGAQEHDDVDGVEVTRIGGKYSLYAKLALYYSKQLKAKYDVIVDEINTIPFFTPLYAKEPYVAFIHQFAANVLFEELPWMQAKSWSFMEPFALRLYGNAPIITSQGTKLDLLNIGIPEKNIHVIDYGVDRSIYRKGKKSLYPHVLYLGRLKRFKGVHLLIDAMKQVVKQIPDAKLSIVGNGDPIYENELRRLTTKLKLENNVAFHELGFQGSVLEKAQLMQEAWVLAYPSSREGFGLAVAEANACGTPTVATDVPGLRETVKNYETGILVPRNCDSIAKSVIHLLTNDELRARMSERACEWSLQFDWDTTAQKMLQILKDATCFAAD